MTRILRCHSDSLKSQVVCDHDGENAQATQPSAYTRCVHITLRHPSQYSDLIAPRVLDNQFPQVYDKCEYIVFGA